MSQDPNQPPQPQWDAQQGRWVLPGDQSPFGHPGQYGQPQGQQQPALAYGQPGQRPPQPPQAPEIKQRKWPWIVGGIVALFVIIGIANGGNNTSTTNTGASGPSSSLAQSPTNSTSPPMPVRNYSGTGDDVVKLDKPTGIAVMTFSCPACTSNTIVSGDGSDSGLVNTIGSYTGKRWIDERDNSITTQLTIKAHGKWTLTIGGLDQATHASGPVSGNGDDVVVLSTNSTTAAVTNRGQSNFIVTTISSGGDIDGPINEIGSYSGTVPLQGPALVEVQSSGSWTITPQ